MLHELKSKFPIDKDQTTGLITYQESELPTLTVESFLQKAMAYISSELTYGDWVIIVVPHTLDH
jgi:hypothetical protein